MDIQASEKRKFLEHTREYVLYDIEKDRWSDPFTYIGLSISCPDFS